MTPAEVLRAARAKIESPERWTQSGYMALNVRGAMAEADGDDACAWCALGALACFVGGERWDEIRRYLVEAIPADLREAGSEVSSFNDRSATTHADILALYDRAIAAAEASS